MAESACGSIPIPQLRPRAVGGLLISGGRAGERLAAH
jgi:hypothetical protein